jgi:hypothetical protein
MVNVPLLMVRLFTAVKDTCLRECRNLRSVGIDAAENVKVS